MQLQRMRSNDGDGMRERHIVHIDRQQNLASLVADVLAETSGCIERQVPRAFLEMDKTDHIGARRKRGVHRFQAR